MHMRIVVLFQVAPSCAIESDFAKAVEEALSSACVSKVYHPDVEQGLGGKAPHLALWHEEGTVRRWCERIMTKMALTVATPGMLNCVTNDDDDWWHRRRSEVKHNYTGNQMSPLRNFDQISDNGYTEP